MTRSIKLLSQSFAALLLLAVGMTAAQAAPVIYDFTLTGEVIVGDETFGFNDWDLTAGDIITATGTFTVEDLGAPGSETGTAIFGAGDSVTIDLLGGQFLTETDGSGISLTFAAGALTDFSYVANSNNFNSDFTSFDDLFGGSVFGEWTGASITAVPVPAAVWLFGSGLLAMFGWARRKPAS